MKWIVIVLVALFVVYWLKTYYVNSLRKKRDRCNVRTVRGQEQIKYYNRLIDRANGYQVP